MTIIPRWFTILILSLALTLSACSGPVTSVPETATLLPTGVPTQAFTPTVPRVVTVTLPPTETLPPTATLAPTATVTPIPPTPTPLPPSATPTIPPTETPGAYTVNIYLVALEDKGASGDEIGCGDSIIPVRVNIQPTTGVLRAALERLLALEDRMYGESGLYNALYQSDLEIESLAVQNGEATMRLTGDLVLGGVCDNPRVQAQLEQTALQFSTVQSVKIWINGEPLEDVLSGEG